MYLRHLHHMLDCQGQIYVIKGQCSLRYMYILKFQSLQKRQSICKCCVFTYTQESSINSPCSSELPFQCQSSFCKPSCVVSTFTNNSSNFSCPPVTINLTASEFTQCHLEPYICYDSISTSSPSFLHHRQSRCQSFAHHSPHSIFSSCPFSLPLAPSSTRYTPPLHRPP